MKSLLRGIMLVGLLLVTYKVVMGEEKESWEKWATQLQSSDWKIKMEAAQKLGDMKIKEAVNPLMDVLKQECLTPSQPQEISNVLRRAYTSSLLEICGKVIPLREYLEKEGTKVIGKKGWKETIGQQMFISFQEFPDGRLFDTFIDVLVNSKNGYHRACSASTLGYLGDKRAIPYLEKALKDDYVERPARDLVAPLVQMAATAALHGLGVKTKQDADGNWYIEK